MIKEFKKKDNFGNVWLCEYDTDAMYNPDSIEKDIDKLGFIIQIKPEWIKKHPNKSPITWERIVESFQHSCDYNDCHYMNIADKYYKLGFIKTTEGEIFPSAMEEIKPETLPLLLQEEFGYITTALRIVSQKQQSKIKEEEYKKQRRKRYDELKKEFEGEK